MADHGKDTARIGKNTLALFFRLLVVTLVGLYTSRVILKVLGQDDFGIYNIVGTIVVFLMFLKQALTNASYRFFTYELGVGNAVRLRETFAMSINVHLILAGILFIVMEAAGPLVISGLNIPSGRMAAAQVVFQISLVSFCLEIVKTPFNSCIIAHERMNFYALTSIVEVVLKLLLVLLLSVITVDKLILYALLMLGSAVVMFIWYVIYCRIYFPETKYLSRFWDKSLFKGMLSYSGWSLLVNAADIVVQQMRNIFMNIFGGVRANAAIGVANQVNGKLSGVLSSFTQAFNPQIIKSYAQGDRAYFMRLLYSTSKLSFFLLFSFAFPVMMNVDFILDFWLVEVPDNSGIFLNLILCYSLVDSFSSPLFMAVHATGNLKVHQILMASIKVINIPLSWILLKAGLPLWSVLAAWAGLNVVCDIVRIIYMKTLIGLEIGAYVKDVFGGMALVLLASVPVPVLFHHYCGEGWWQLAAFMGIFFALYVPAVFFLGLNAKERGYALDIIKSKLPKR